MNSYDDFDTPIPENQDDAIDAYFDGSTEDYYALESATVQGAA